MQLVSFKINELNDFVASDLYQKLSSYPVSKHRALSQVVNPRANSNDVVLIIAYSDEMELLGYIGALPDSLYLSGQPVRIAWNSCWWSHPQKGKPVVMKLFAELIKAWDGNICFSDLNNSGKDFIQHTGRYSVLSYPGYRFFYRFYFAQWISTKFKFFDNSVLMVLCGFIDRTLNAIVSLFRSRVSGDECQMKVAHALTVESCVFIRTFPQNNCTMRDSLEFDWAINHPWIVTDKNISQKYAGKYFFSHSALSFQTYFLEIWQYGVLKGVFLLQERNGHYRIPYAFFNPEDIILVGDNLFRHLFHCKALSFTVYHSQIGDYMTNKRGYLKKSVIERYAAFPKKFGDTSFLRVQDGDGDSLFC